MLFRRITASLVMFLFIFTSTVMFAVAAFSQTILQPTFYKGKVMEKAYYAFIELVTEKVYESDTLIAESFTKNDIHTHLKDAFPQEKFEILAQEVIKNLVQTQNVEKPLTISLEPFRESIAAMSDTLAKQIFQAIPICDVNEIPVEKNGLPNCINQEITLDVEPLIEQRFKKVLMGSIPEQISLDLSSTRNQESKVILFFFQSIGNIKYLLYCVLLTLLIAMALIIFKPFTEVILYSGLAFGLSGAVGYLSGFFLESTAQIILTKIPVFTQQRSMAEFGGSLFSSVMVEMQKTALIFFAFGALLILIQVFIKKAKE